MGSSGLAMTHFFKKQARIGEKCVIARPDPLIIGKGEYL